MSLMSSCIAFVCFNMSAHQSVFIFVPFQICLCIDRSFTPFTRIPGPIMLRFYVTLERFSPLCFTRTLITLLTRRSILMGSLVVSIQVFHTTCFMITIITRILSAIILGWKVFVVHENSGKRKPRLTLITGMLESPMSGLPVDDKFYCTHICHKHSFLPYVQN